MNQLPDMEKQARRTVLKAIPLFILVAFAVPQLILWIMTTDKGIAEAFAWFGLAFIPFSAIILFITTIGCFFKRVSVYFLAATLSILGFYGGLVFGWFVIFKG